MISNTSISSPVAAPQQQRLEQTETRPTVEQRAPEPPQREPRATEQPQQEQRLASPQEVEARVQQPTSNASPQISAYESNQGSSSEPQQRGSLLNQQV